MTFSMEKQKSLQLKDGKIIILMVENILNMKKKELEYLLKKE